MEQATEKDLRYPIGRYQLETDLTPERRAEMIAEIEAAPRLLREAVAGLTDQQLDTEYRPGGWTVRQVVHHIADSHINSIIRFKWALTEDAPTIKGYDEAAWAKLPDSREPIESSLRLIDALHERWVELLRAMAPEDYARKFHHPEHDRDFSLEVTLGIYAWHGKHHTAHITSLRERNGW